MMVICFCVLFSSVAAAVEETDEVGEDEDAAEDEEDADAEDREPLPLPLPSSCLSRQRVSLDMTYGDAAAMMRECVGTSPPSPPLPPPPLPGRSSRSHCSGWLERMPSMRARIVAAWSSHFTMSTLDEEEEEEEDPLLILRLLPPREELRVLIGSLLLRSRSTN